VKEIAAILLAAGRSRRMGKFKPLLPFGNTTVIKSCLNNLTSAGVEARVVVVGHRAVDLREHLQDYDATFAINPDPDSAMGVSIAHGINAIPEQSRSILIALVDHPAVNAETIKAIIDQWKRGARLVQPEHDGRGGHPVLIDLIYREELLHLDDSRGLRGFFEDHRTEVVRLPVDCPFIARDMDTWEDYVRLHEEVFRRSPATDLR
jgi:CTP:molybdopterin cytidylyltransferase MocA